MGIRAMVLGQELTVSGKLAEAIIDLGLVPTVKSKSDGHSLIAVSHFVLTIGQVRDIIHWFSERGVCYGTMPGLDTAKWSLLCDWAASKFGTSEQDTATLSFG